MQTFTEFINYLVRISRNMKRFGFAAYCTLASLATLCVSITIAGVLQLPYQEPVALSPAFLRASVAGFIETILFQSIPYFIFRRRYSETVQVLAMALPFGLMHFSNGFVGIANAIAVGVIFSLSYLTWSRQAVMTAILMTTTIHTVHNAVLLAL